MKRVFCLLTILSLLLCGCISDPLQSGKNPTDEETAGPIHTALPTEPEQTAAPTEPESVVDRIIFEHHYSDPMEYATLTACDRNGNTVWTYLSDLYPVGQLDFISDIGGNADRYYIVENGSILAFDMNTGTLLWKNDDFCGSPAGTDCAAFDEAGNLYICGFFGPDLFAVDSNGNTICSKDYLHNDYYWACSLTLTGDWITVELDGGPYGDMDTPYVACVNVRSLSGSSLSLAQAIEQVQQFYNTTTGADGTYVVFEDECFEDNGCYVLTVRYQLSDAEAEQIIANGGTPEANTYAATVKVDKETGYIFPEA